MGWFSRLYGKKTSPRGSLTGRLPWRAGIDTVAAMATRETPLDETPPSGGITALTNAVLSLELVQAMFIGMDPPKHTRIKGLFQRGFTPKRIAEHEDAIRAITVD